MARRSRGTVAWREDRHAYFVWWIDRHGRRRQARGGATVEEAEAELQRRLDDEDRAHAGEPLCRSLAEFLADDHLPILASRLAPKAYGTHARRLLRVARMLHGQAMHELTGAEAERVFVRLAKTRSPSTLAAYRSHLVVAWEAAIRRGLATENPWQGVEVGRAQERAVPFLSEEDLERLYGRVPRRLRPLVRFLGETGLRLGEALAVTWQDVRRDETTVTVRRSKSGRVRHVPLSEAARAVLAEQRSRRGAVPMSGLARVFDDLPAALHHGLREEWRRAVRRAGWPALRFHDLRHARASLLVRAGVPVPTVAAWLGHATPGLVLTRYGHHAPEDHLTRALTTLEAVRTGRRDLSGGSGRSDRGARGGRRRVARGRGAS